MNVHTTQHIHLPYFNRQPENKPLTLSNTTAKNEDSNTNSYTLEISGEAKELYSKPSSSLENLLLDGFLVGQEALDPEELLEETNEESPDFLSRMEAVRDMNEGLADGWRRKIAALKIAMRIANGDNVPMKDHKFLAEFDSKMYAEAIKMSISSTNKDPKSYDALSDMFDEDDTNNARHSPESTEQSVDIGTESMEIDPDQQS